MPRPGGSRRLPAADPRPHLARPRGRRDPPDRPGRDRADRRRARRARRPRHRDVEPAEDALAHLRGDPGAVLLDPRRVLRHGRGLPRAGHRGRSPTGSAACRRGDVRGHPHGPARGGALDRRLLPPAGDRRLAARASTSSTPPSPRRGRATSWRRSPTTSRSPATTSRSRSARSSPHLPQFRRHLGPTAFFEGWGLYTERLSDEMGLYSGDLDRIGVLSFDAWRAARLVVDTGIHAMGWSRDRAIAFMLEHTALAPNNIVNEVDRYIVLPGQALAYKLGQLEILRLRDEARATPRRPVRHPRLPRHGPRQRRARPADAAQRRRGLGHGSARRGLMADAGGGAPDAPLAIAAAVPRWGSCATATSGRSSSSWTLGVAADWALLVVALLVAYDAGGAVLVGLVSLTRMLPATAVNLVVDTSRFRAARARAGRGQPRPRGWRGRRGGRQRRRRDGARVRGRRRSRPPPAPWCGRPS